MSQDDTLTVGILIFDHVEVLDFCGPFEVFCSAGTLGESHERRERFHVLTIAEDGRLITCNGGLLVKPQATIDQHPPLDILVVPGGDVFPQLANPRVLAWLGRQDQQLARTWSK